MLFAITSGNDNWGTIGIVLALVIFDIILSVFWLKMLLHAIKSKSVDRTSWIIIVLLMNSIGALLYFWRVYRKGAAAADRAKKQKSRGLSALASSLVVLAIIGVIWLLIQGTLAPINHIYEPGSLSSYTLTTVESGQFNKIPYVHLIYEDGQGKVSSTIAIHEFELHSTKFSPPKNCGLSRPMGPLLGEKIYGKVPCHLEKEIDADTRLYLPDTTIESEAANYYIVHKRTIVTINAAISVNTVTAIAQSLKDTNFSSLKQKVRSVPNQPATCQRGPVEGSLEVDLAEPHPFTDARTDEIVRLLNARSIQLRDGSIVHKEGKDYSSGKYIVFVAGGTEATALAKLKSLPYVTHASQTITVCPLQELKIGN